MVHKDTTREEIGKLAPPCDCSLCAHGCSMGSGILLPSDVPLLAAHLGVTEEQLVAGYLEPVEQFGKTFYRPKLKRKEHRPYGPCIFFDKHKHCAVHPSRPTQCRIAMGCKAYGEALSLWFMLNHLVDTSDAESMRQFHSYLSAGGKTLPGGSFKDFVPDKKRQARILSYEER